MFEKIRSDSEFVRNVLTLITGTTVAQAIPIAISPILTRIYAPQEFGVFALYLSIVGILAVAATGRYELAIMTPDTDEDAINVMVLSASVAFFLSFLLLLFVFFFNSSLASALNRSSITNWLYLVPLSVLLTGIYQSFSYWLNRKKQYRRLAISRAVQAIAIAILTLAIGFCGVGAAGLVFGFIAGQGLAAIFLGWHIYSNDSKVLSNICLARIKTLGISFLHFPKFLIFSHSIGALNFQIPVLAITKLYDLTTVGFFSMTNQIVGIPNRLIARAVGDVFRQRATEEYHRYKKFDDVFVSTLKNTFLIAILPFVLLFFWGADLFAIVLGNEWRVAGEYAQILSISFFFSFITTPVDKSALVVGNTKYILSWHVLRLASNSILIVVTFIWNLNVSQYLVYLMIINTFHYILDVLVEYRFSLGYKYIFSGDRS